MKTIAHQYVHAVRKVARKYPSLNALCSGVLVLIAFYVPHAWIIVFVALVPLFHAIAHSRSTWHAFLLGLTTGVLITGGTSFWYFWSTPAFPQESMVLNFSLVAGSWFMMVVALSPTVGFFAIGTRMLREYARASFVLVPLLWVATESARMLAFSFVTYAPDIYNPPFYSTGFLGYPLADSSSWLQLAAFGGIYLMSFITALVGYLVYRAFHVRAWKRLSCMVVGILLVHVAPIADLRDMATSTEHTLRIGLMSIYTPESLRGPGFKYRAPYPESVAAEVAALGAYDLDLILLPEGGSYLSKEFSKEAPTRPTVIDLMITRNPFGRNESVAVAGSLTGESAFAIRAKHVLTPQGEYVIGLTHLAGALFGFGEKVAEYTQWFNITPASWGTGLAIGETGLRASLMFCNESIAPGFAAHLARKEGSSIILVMNSHGSFYDSYLLETDTIRFLKVQAVEAELPLLASADQSPAYALDAFGRVEAVIGGKGVSESAVISVDLGKKYPEE